MEDVVEVATAVSLYRTLSLSSTRRSTRRGCELDVVQPPSLTDARGHGAHAWSKDERAPSAREAIPSGLDRNVFILGSNEPYSISETMNYELRTATRTLL